MIKYIIKAELSPGYDYPEFAPEQPLKDGIEVDGYLLMTMKDDRPQFVSVQGISTLDLARMLSIDDGSEASSTIRQALAIAEGLNKAAEIKRTSEKAKAARDIAEWLKAK